MAGFRGVGYAGVAGADLENAPQGDVPFTSPFGLPVTRANIWRAGGTQPGISNRGVPGEADQSASGNPDVSSRPVYGPEKSPYGGDTGPSTIPQFGIYRPLNPEQESAVGRPGRPVGGANDKLTVLDRHGMFKVGYENSGRSSGNTDPPMDGPPRPSLWLVQRSLSYQQGTDTTGATDDLTRDYTRNAEGMYVGSQGDGWSRVYGGVPGLYQEYGSYQGMSPNSPGVSAGIHSPTPEGQPGDGPHDVWAGPPHGLHSPTLPTYSQTLGRYMDTVQMARPRVDRPSNSPIAGQSFSQTVQSQGSTGTVAASQRMGSGGYNTRSRGNGWRGRG
jgi:hypothetical protein